LIQTGQPRQPVGLVAHQPQRTVRPYAYNRHMTKTQMTHTLQELQDYMFDTMCSNDMAVDWYCDRFNVSATDEVIDFVLDAHDAFFGN